MINGKSIDLKSADPNTTLVNSAMYVINIIKKVISPLVCQITLAVDVRAGLSTWFFSFLQTSNNH